MDINACIMTGPIGSGKSYVCSLLKEHGFKVLDLDVVSNQILNSEDGCAFLNKNFPAAIEKKDLNKEILAKEVFSDNSKLKLLEEFIHPKVKIHIESWVGNLDSYGVIEVSAPKSKSTVYKTIVLNVPEEIRIQRLLHRGMKIEDINRRINVQQPQTWWNKLGDNLNNINSNDVEKDLVSLLKRWGWVSE